MGAGKSHHLPSAHWSPRKPVIQLSPSPEACDPGGAQVQGQEKMQVPAPAERSWRFPRFLFYFRPQQTGRGRPPRGSICFARLSNSHASPLQHTLPDTPREGALAASLAPLRPLQLTCTADPHRGPIAPLPHGFRAPRLRAGRASVRTAWVGMASTI